MLTKTFLVTGDIHTGGAFALWPEYFPTSNGNYVRLNRGQAYLQKVFDDILRRVPDGLDGMILMGDIIEGDNYKGRGAGLTEAVPEHQAEAANFLLQPLFDKLKPDALCRTLAGSRYHVNGEYERMIGNGRFTMHDWLLQPLVFGDTVVLMDAAHHQSYCQVNKSMPLERETRIAYEKMAKDRREVPDHLLIMRAHTHHGWKCWTEDGRSTAMTIPCMKLQDGFAAGGKMPNNTRPDTIGMVLVHVSDSMPYVQVEPLVYPHPLLNMEEPYE